MTRVPSLVPVLSVRGATKRYGGIVALNDVSLDVARGEVRAVLGKNGAGKSTLVNLLSGAVQLDAGVIVIDGRPVRIDSPIEALKHGIVTVHQELMIIPGLTVGENIMLGRWGDRGIVDERGIERQTRAALRRLHSDLDPRQSSAHLSIADWQTIEIARALTQDVRVLILDEPTSALPPPDADALVQTVRALAGEGVSVIYVTHRLDEIPRVADSVTVFRDGEVVATVAARNISTAKLVNMMVGSVHPGAVTLAAREAAEPSEQEADVVLRVADLRVPDRLFGVSFALRRGEILGLAGLVGAGATEVLRAIYGLIPGADGTITLGEQTLSRRSPVRMRRRGVAFASDDRKREGLFLGLSVADNIGLGNVGLVSRFGIIQPFRLAAVTRRAIKSLGIRTSGLQQRVQYLSGGNQQKVVFARCLGSRVSVLLLDEPTRGVDVEAKAQIYELLRGLAREGLGVIVAPSEFDEFSYLCDRVIVLRDGLIVAEVRPPNTSAERIMSLALGDGQSDPPNPVRELSIR